jgi:hypothetical protein
VRKASCPPDATERSALGGSVGGEGSVGGGFDGGGGLVDGSVHGEGGLGGLGAEGFIRASSEPRYSAAIWLVNRPRLHGESTI